MGSAYISRRSSWNSLEDEAVQAAEDMEAAQRSCPMSWEKQATFSHPQNMVSNNTEAQTSMISGGTSGTQPSEKSYHHPRPAVDGLPVNFGLVVPGVYRSSYPKPEDYHFLGGLKLKTVVTLVKREEVDHDLLAFVNANGINQVIFNMKGTKKEAIPIGTMRPILELVLDRSNYPLLVHCNHGKHRTGCVVAAIRLLSGWQLNMAIDEYKTYAAPKIRDCDVDYIKDLQCTPLQGLYSLHAGRTARFTPVQVRTLFRALLFSTFVMVLWLLSGSQMRRIDDTDIT
ncbi:hypothetical protein E4U42_005952 [Claviceps africana]|uniref:diphosphoinositol-polyphosphate diphosphatase n=1 Tax=Claviceps africana TaxID=83212 RepID=A0A8K0NH32_9HYPO|nr:hypothetical protein E4U42_005952 [Claviceps africana]